MNYQGSLLCQKSHSSGDGYANCISLQIKNYVHNIVLCKIVFAFWVHMCVYSLTGQKYILEYWKLEYMYIIIRNDKTVKAIHIHFYSSTLLLYGNNSLIYLFFLGILEKYLRQSWYLTNLSGLLKRECSDCE